MKKFSVTVCCVLLMVGVCSVSLAGGTGKEKPTGVIAEVGPTIPSVKVTWANSPYFDHSYAVIGVKKGFFKDVGISIVPDPAGKVIGADQMPIVLNAGTVDSMSVYTPIIFGALKESPKPRVYVYANAFMGFAIMGKPEYKSVEEFIDEGYSDEEAIRLAVQQLKGNTFAFPAETGPKAFIELSFMKGRITLDDVETIIVDDPKAIQMMITGQADFHCGGVPAHFTLVKRGFKEILTNGHLAQFAEPTGDSVELLSIGHAGWGANIEWIEDNPDTVLRMASVLYRIMDFMNDNPKDAFSAHIPYVNSIAGTDFTVEDGPVLYQLNNFKTFEEQEPWFLNPDDPFYYKWNLGINAKMWVEKGLWKEGQFGADNICLADDTYRELLELKKKSEQAMSRAERAISEARNEGQDVDMAEKILSQAKDFYEWRDYLDSNRFATAAYESLQ